MLNPPALSQALPMHAACAAATHVLPPPGPAPAPLPTHTPTPRPARRPISTRQGATTFNQPLSFDTSSVTDMHNMFYVRSARALAYSLHI